GEVSARLAGSPWGQLVTERILKPLGMNRTTPDLSTAAATGNMATGYQWVEHRGEWERKQARDIGAAGPAGSIVSTAGDMARWIELQLSDGEVAGKRLIGAATLAEIHKAQMKIDPSGESHYGLGWTIRRWRDNRYLEHGGNIDGFGASVGFLPDRKIGFVVLTNTTSNSLQSLTGGLIFEAMLTDAYKGETEPAEDFSPLLGEYEADLVPFEGKIFKIEDKNGVLSIDIPGQQVFALKPPDAKGRRYFQITDQVYLTFVMQDGRASVLNLHQGGLKFELWRKGSEPPADVDLAVAGPLLGDYKTDDGTVFTVLIHRGRLAVDVPEQMKYALHPPKEGQWHLRAKSEYFVTFAENNLVLHQDGRTITAKRSGPPTGQTVTTMAEFDRIRQPARRRRIIASMGHSVARANVVLEHAGLTGSITVRWTGTDRWRQDWDVQSFLTLTSVSTATSAWIAPSFDSGRQLVGKEIADQFIQHPLALFGDWSQMFDQVVIRGTTTVRNQRVALVELTRGELSPVKAYVDIKRGDVLKAEFPSLAGPPITVEYRDFRPVRGLRLPFVQEMQSPVLGKTIITYSAVRTRQKAPSDAFPDRLPK
ncbi:MAG: serine hydrolase, partial [Myxococcota bacterium]